MLELADDASTLFYDDNGRAEAGLGSMAFVMNDLDPKYDTPAKRQRCLPQ
jgi:hypothetical protein